MDYTNWISYFNLYSYYPNPYLWGPLMFFLVPLLLWFLATAFVRRRESSARYLAFIAGSDSRLSLSRLQALVWTLVIFGSFAAAMTIHIRILPLTQAEVDENKSNAATADKVAGSLKEELDKAETELKSFIDKKKIANDVLIEATAKLQSTVNHEAAPEQEDAARKELTTAQTNYETADSVFTAHAQEFEKLMKRAEAAKAKQAEMKDLASSSNWVLIPTSLLALAGIAIGSGVFSSVISAVNNEEKTATLTGIRKLDENEKKNSSSQGVANSKSINLLKITGTDLGKSGRVRLGWGNTTVSISILFWNENGTEIIADVPNGAYNALIVDTTNGKLSLGLKDQALDQKAVTENEIKKQQAEADKTTKMLQEKEGLLNTLKAGLQSLIDKNAPADQIAAANTAVATAQVDVQTQTGLLNGINSQITALQEQIRPGKVENLSLGNPISYYEFSDLFRDDKSPMRMDLMKFQMFGWTVVAISIYSWLFLSNLSNTIQSLPVLPESIVILTGLSQAGYLAGKGTSNIRANDEQKP
jgi:hypothetical protein